MSLITSPGIVLHRKRHLENDIRLKLFLRQEGKVIATVKSGQRWGFKLKSLQEPFTLADFQVFLPPHGVYARVIGGKLVSSFPLLRGNLAAYSRAIQCHEIIDLLLPYHAPAPTIFDLLQKTLQSFQSGMNPNQTYLAFLAQMLEDLGHGDPLPEILKSVPVVERGRVTALFKEWEAVTLSPGSLGRCMAVLEKRLEYILPRKLKSGVLV